LYVSPGVDPVKATAPTALPLVLNIDGQERPGAVEIGAGNMKLRNLPLFVNLR
jgi:hypothetical protein